MRTNKIKNVKVFIPEDKELIQNLSINYNKVISSIIVSQLSYADIQLLIKNYEVNKDIVRQIL